MFILVSVGVPSWLNELFSPPLPMRVASVLSRDIVDHLSDSIMAVAQWLVRAKVPVHVKNDHDFTPLHIAAIGGEVALLKLLLELGASPNVRDRKLRTPLHYAAALGHVQVAKLLMQHGGRTDLADTNGVTAMDIIAAPGPVRPDEALLHLNVTQRPARQISRLLHPERYFYGNQTSEAVPKLVPPDNYDPRAEEWTAGSGGWGTERLKGYEADMDCSDIDQYWADEIDEESLFRDYLARNSPVLIRGLLHSWQV